MRRYISKIQFMRMTACCECARVCVYVLRKQEARESFCSEERDRATQMTITKDTRTVIRIDVGALNGGELVLSPDHDS